MEGNPDEAGQARRQMSLHAMWWGYRWSTGARSSLHALSDSTGIDHLLECSRNAWKVGLIQGGENTLSRFVKESG